MKRITIIVPDGQCSLSTVACIVGAYEILTRANSFQAEVAGAQQSGQKKRFAIELAGVSELTEFNNGLFTVS